MRSPGKVILALSAVSALLAFSAAPARAGDSVDECVQLASTPVAKGISLGIDNHCDRSLSCRLSWKVTCESATGKVTRTRTGSASLVLASSASGSALAGASECGDSWRVDDVSWACSPMK